MSKTPVSMLQELMTKRNVLPNYELLTSSEGLGTHTPTFYYKVTADQVQAVGKGRSKKEAKHEAARLALEKFADIGSYRALENVPASPVHSSSPDPGSPQKIQLNAVGALKDLCAEKNIPPPEFNLKLDVGPPHLRQFTIECKVATMTVTSTDLTKKKSKQSAAQKMLHRLMDALPEEIEELSVSSDMQTMQPYDESIVKSYSELSTLIKKKINWGMKISDFPKALKNILEEKDQKYSDLWHDVSTLSEVAAMHILNKLDLHCNFQTVEQEDKIIAVAVIDSVPEFSVCGIGKTETVARSEAILELYNFLQIMTK